MGRPARATLYGASVYVSLSGTDPGGAGVAATYYTTDGSTPTTSSPVYQTPMLVLGSETIKFFSVDNAGNAEAVRTANIQVAPNPDPVIAVAGDIGCDPDQPGFNGGQGTNIDCRALGTSRLLVGADDVLTLGDNQYQCGGYSAFMQSYDRTWGYYKAITYPVPGDNDLNTTGGTGCPVGTRAPGTSSTSAAPPGSPVPPCRPS